MCVRYKQAYSSYASVLVPYKASRFGCATTSSMQISIGHISGWLAYARFTHHVPHVHGAGKSCGAPTSGPVVDTGKSKRSKPYTATVGHHQDNGGYCPFTGGWVSRAAKTSAKKGCKGLTKQGSGSRAVIKPSCVCTSCKPAKAGLHRVAVARPGFDAWVQAQDAGLGLPAKLAQTTARYSGGAAPPGVPAHAARGTSAAAAVNTGKQRQRTVEPASGGEQRRKKR